MRDFGYMISISCNRVCILCNEIDDYDAISEVVDERGPQKIKNVKDFESKSVHLIRTLTYLLLDFTCLCRKDKIRVYGFGKGSFDTDLLDIKDFLPSSPYALYDAQRAVRLAKKVCLACIHRYYRCR